MAGAGGRPGGECGETVLRMEGGETEGDGDETGLGWLGTGGDGGEALRTCGDSNAGLELLRAGGWLDEIELGRTGTEVAEARDVKEAPGTGRGPLGRLNAGGDEGKVASEATSGRTGA